MVLVTFADKNRFFVRKLNEYINGCKSKNCK